MSEPIHILSLGAGVQSSTMALMAAHGEITPMPKCAIFADTQAEPKAIYEWIDWLRPKLPFPIHTVTAGNLEFLQTKNSISKDGTAYVRNMVPAFTGGTKAGILNRSCTRDFKIYPLQREYRKMLKESGSKLVIQWIGISLDEIWRMKEARVKYIKNRWPLVDMRIRRNDCLIWMRKHGYPTPPKSACIFCPYHSANQWREIKANPEEWQRVVNFEKDWNKLIRADTRKTQLKNASVFLHPSLKPIDQVDFSTDEDHGQQVMFGNECEGMCGV